MRPFAWLCPDASPVASTGRRLARPSRRVLSGTHGRRVPGAQSPTRPAGHPGRWRPARARSILSEDRRPPTADHRLNADDW